MSALGWLLNFAKVIHCLELVVTGSTFVLQLTVHKYVLELPLGSCQRQTSRIQMLIETSPEYSGIRYWKSNLAAT